MGEVEEEDEEIVRRVLAGDTDSFSLLVRRYESKIRGFCANMLGDRELAWDAAQEIFIKVFKKLEGFRAEAKFSTWLFNISRNHCIDLLRKKKIFRFISFDFISEEGLSAEFQSGTGVDRQLEAKEVSKFILSKLSPDQRALLLLREFQGYSNNEIAEIVGSTEDSVKSKLKRIRKKVKELGQLEGGKDE